MLFFLCQVIPVKAEIVPIGEDIGGMLSESITKLCGDEVVALYVYSFLTDFFFWPGVKNVRQFDKMRAFKPLESD